MGDAAAVTEPGMDREFEYHANPWWVAAWACTLAFVILAALLLPFWMALSNAMQASGAAGVRAAHTSPARLWLPLGVDCLTLGMAAALITWWLVREVRLERYASVLVTRVGISVTDWRGRDGRLFWEQVEELVAAPLGRYPLLSWVTLELRGAGKRLCVDLGIQDREEFRDLIIAQAGLTEKSDTWWGTVYRRPGS